MALQRIWIDDALVAVEKPPGILVIPGRPGPPGAPPPPPTLKELVSGELGPIWVVHRLDRGTSGICLFARTAAAHRTLSMAFEGREVEKRYLALVEGDLGTDAELRVDAAITSGRKGKMRLARPGEPGAKAAVTRVRALGRAPAASLVECFPETGRTHQIRLHLLHLGHPLKVDPDYGREPADPEVGRILTRTPLHAAGLRLVHPVTGAPLALESPLPEDMAQAWASLGPKSRREQP